MKGTGEDQVVVGRELAEAGLEFALVDETAGLVDDNEGEDGPGGSRWLAAHSACHGRVDTHGG